jgi:hypothetical protein
MTADQFIKLYNLNVSNKVEKKNWLSYLSWSYARAEFKKVHPDATYEIKMFDNKPYVYDENLWYMVFTSVTVDWLTHDMRLPVMDYANNAMKNTAYTYKVKDKAWKLVEKTVQPATMFDVNKTIMRCLTKNLAMFGLGLYIYNWEDLPEELWEQKTEQRVEKKDDDNKPRITEDQIIAMKNNVDWIKWFKSAPEMVAKIREKYKVSKDNAKWIENLYSIITWENEADWWDNK